MTSPHAPAAVARIEDDLLAAGVNSENRVSFWYLEKTCIICCSVIHVVHKAQHKSQLDTNAWEVDLHAPHADFT